MHDGEAKQEMLEGNNNVSSMSAFCQVEELAQEAEQVQGS